jgi:hypothetical protein
MTTANNSNTSSTLINNNNIISTFTTTGTYMSNCGIWNSPVIEQEKLILYIDLMAQILGIDMNFQKFSEMSLEEIKSFTRDIKLNKIL